MVYCHVAVAIAVAVAAVVAAADDDFVRSSPSFVFLDVYD